jgi:NAD+ kinase
VLPLDSLSTTVERDEATVALLVDGERHGVIEPSESAVVARVGTLRTAVVGASESRYR